jgi:hypothetical protein
MGTVMKYAPYIHIMCGKVAKVLMSTASSSYCYNINIQYSARQKEKEREENRPRGNNISENVVSGESSKSSEGFPSEQVRTLNRRSGEVTA